MFLYVMVFPFVWFIVTAYPLLYSFGTNNLIVFFYRVIAVIVFTYSSKIARQPFVYIENCVRNELRTKYHLSLKRL